MRPMILCPRCKSAVPTAEALRPATFPFCSERCKLVDLGAWLDESYRIPQPIDPSDAEAIDAVLSAREGEG